MNFFLNLKLKSKLVAVMLSVLLAFIAVVGLNLYAQYKQMLANKSLLLESVVSGLSDQIVALDQQVKEGEMSLENAQAMAKKLVAAYRYENGNYVWIHDFDTNMVMHPIKPELDGKSLKNSKDPNGVYLFNEMVDVVKQSGAGYVSYYWSKPGSEEPVAKLSYVEGVTQWGWILGTGLYLDDIKTTLSEESLKALALIIVILIILSVLFFALNRSIVSPVLMMSNALRQVRENGDLSAQIDLNQKDEVGDIVRQFNSHIEFLKEVFADTNRVVGHLAQGKFKERIELDMQGDFLTLKEGVNASVEQIDNMMQELERVMHSLAEGNFSIKIETDVEGGYRQILEQSQATLNVLNASVNGIVKVMEQMRAGRFGERVTVELKGDLAELKNAINDSMMNLDAAVKDLTSVVVAQSKGDLTTNITNAYEGELNSLKEAVNGNIHTLNSIVSDIVDVSINVSDTSIEVSEGSLSLNERTQQMAASLEQTAASMEEITATINQNMELSNQANQFAIQATNEAKASGEIVNQAVESMKSITDSSGRIAEIITLIDSIAFQTNLLALNAAVEAARAGEHGRGFAVVAGEVRSLAQKSAEASREIKNLIDASVANVESGSRFVEQTGEAFDSIHLAVQKVSEMVHEIASATKEQAQGISQINLAVSNLDTVTQQNAALVEETSASAENLSQQSVNLKDLMEFFKTDEEQSVLKLTDETEKGA